jgi:hypothetical protein
MEEQPLYGWHISVETSRNVWTYVHDTEQSWSDGIANYLNELELADEFGRSYGATWFEPTSE